MKIPFQKVTKFFSKKYPQKFSTITQFFDVPFGVFLREITGNYHSRLLKFKMFQGSMPSDPPPLECVRFRARLVEFR
jgi:hypothetical protein